MKEKGCDVLHSLDVTVLTFHNLTLLNNVLHNFTQLKELIDMNCYRSSSSTVHWMLKIQLSRHDTPILGVNFQFKIQLKIQLKIFASLFYCKQVCISVCIPFFLQESLLQCLQLARIIYPSIYLLEYISLYTGVYIPTINTGVYILCFSFLLFQQ